MTKKTCIECLEVLSIEDFGVTKGKKHSRCIPCFKVVRAKNWKTYKENGHTPIEKKPDVVGDLKICSECGSEKLVGIDFRIRKGRIKSDSMCKECQTRRNRVTERLRYANMSAEDKVDYIAKKSKANIKRFKTNPEALAKKKIYEKTDKAIYNRYKSDSGRGNRNYTFALTFSEFSNIINSDCFYCGTENCRGCDRVDNTIGYSVENCVPCCRRCNEIKMTRSVDELYIHIRKMANHFNKNKKVITDRFAPK